MAGEQDPARPSRRALAGTGRRPAGRGLGPGYGLARRLADTEIKPVFLPLPGHRLTLALSAQPGAPAYSPSPPPQTPHPARPPPRRSEEHTSELQSPCNLVCRLLLETQTAQT